MLEFQPDEFVHQVETALTPLPEALRGRMSQTIGQMLADYLHGSSSDSWRLYTLRDAFIERPPLEYVVAGLFALPSLNIVYGAPGSKKSMWLADLAVCVSAGHAWPGDFSPAKQQSTHPGNDNRATIASPVLWCDFDNGPRRTHERFEAIARARGVSPEAPLYYASMPRPQLDASSFDSVADLNDRINAIDAKLVVIDNLGLISGDADENSSEMVKVMGNLRQLAETTGAAVVVIHHQRKSNGQGASSSGDSVRGHSSILASIDLALLIQQERGSKTITIESTKVRDVDVMPFSADFHYGHRPNSTELAVARFVGASVNDTQSDWAVTQAILTAVLEDHPINQSALKNAVKNLLPTIGHNRIVEIAKQMVATGKLVSTSGMHGAVLYDVPMEAPVQHPDLTSTLPA